MIIVRENSEVVIIFPEKNDGFSHVFSWLIGFPILWVIIIPSKPGSIIPYSNQLTSVFLMAHLRYFALPSISLQLHEVATSTNGLENAARNIETNAISYDESYEKLINHHFSIVFRWFSQKNI